MRAFTGSRNLRLSQQLIGIWLVSGVFTVMSRDVPANDVKWGSPVHSVRAGVRVSHETTRPNSVSGDVVAFELWLENLSGDEQTVEVPAETSRGNAGFVDWDLQEVDEHRVISPIVRGTSRMVFHLKPQESVRIPWPRCLVALVSRDWSKDAEDYACHVVASGSGTVSFSIQGLALPDATLATGTVDIPFDAGATRTDAQVDQFRIAWGDVRNDLQAGVALIREWPGPPSRQDLVFAEVHVRNVGESMVRFRYCLPYDSWIIFDERQLGTIDAADTFTTHRGLSFWSAVQELSPDARIRIRGPRVNPGPISIPPRGFVAGQVTDRTTKPETGSVLSTGVIAFDMDRYSQLVSR